MVELLSLPMPIALLCPSCKVRLTLGDDRAGHTINCPRCSAGITVPLPTSSPHPPPRPPVPPPPPARSSHAPPPPPARYPPPAAYPPPVPPPPYAPPYAPPPAAAPPPGATKYCHECGECIRARAEICPKCGVRQPDLAAGDRGSDRKSRLAYIVLALLFGGLGVHNFYANRTTVGLCQLVIFLVSLPLIFVLIGLMTIFIPILWAFLEIIVVDRDGHGVPMV